MRPSVRRNSALNIAAFGITSAIGIAIVPVIINRFGLAALGMIAISRLLLPTGMAGILDFGLPEATTRLAAANSARGNHALVSLHVGFSVAASVLVGILCAVALGASASWLACVTFDVPAESCEIFATTLRFTAVALPLLFAGQIADAWLRGLEDFLTIRIADVLFNVTYAIGVIVFATAFEQVIYLYLALSAAKACLMLGIFAARRQRARETLEVRTELRPLFRYAFAAWKNKAISIAFRYLPQALVATLLGAASAGIFEALTRVPYFIKTALGVTTMALVPAAARVSHQENAAARTSELGVKASSIVGLLFVPAQITLAVFAHHFLRLWLGAEYVHLAPWLAIMMIWPLSMTCFQVMDSMLSIDARYIERVAFASLIQLVVLLIVSFALLSTFAQFAFVIGLAVAGILAVAWRMRFAKLEGVPPAFLTKPILGSVVSLIICGSIAAIDVSLNHWLAESVVRSAGTMLVGLAAAALGYYTLCLDASSRSVVRSLIRVPDSPWKG
jgi:O-antigen/teichoic acid export membrane protein